MPMLRHILISVVGLISQVITETLYYFCCHISPGISITLTTLADKQSLEKALFVNIANIDGDSIQI
jgi:hypothetical protein